MARIFVTGPASGNSAQATSGCWQHHFCFVSLFSNQLPLGLARLVKVSNPLYL
jgi:hypothetical protein